MPSANPTFCSQVRHYCCSQRKKKRNAEPAHRAIRHGLLSIRSVPPEPSAGPPQLIPILDRYETGRSGVDGRSAWEDGLVRPGPVCGRFRPLVRTTLLRSRRPKGNVIELGRSLIGPALNFRLTPMPVSYGHRGRIPRRWSRIARAGRTSGRSGVLLAQRAIDGNLHQLVARSQRA